MAHRYSRYRASSVLPAPDARGRVSATAALRALPATPGRFRHVVSEGERLDQLAYKYYEEPLLWWHICDANPEFLSPLALLGQEPVVATRFPLRASLGGNSPDWPELIRDLSGLVGVEDVAIEETIEYHTTNESVEIAPQVVRNVPITRERFKRTLLVTYNNHATAAETLIKAIRAGGLEIEPPVEVGQLGRQIVIPPLRA
jgi:hypothetical protein